MVIYQIVCKLGKKGFIQFAEKNIKVAKKISPCGNIGSGEFDSFRVIKGDESVFIDFLELNKLAYSIQQI